MKRAILFLLAASCAPATPEPNTVFCPVAKAPLEPWIEGCEIALRCGFYAPEHVRICHGCTKLWIDVNNALEKAQVGVNLARSLPCETIRQEVESMGIGECVRFTVGNL